MYLHFTKKGYLIMDDPGKIYMDETPYYKNLLHFASMDLSKLPLLLKEYVSEVMDTKTFELIGSPSHEKKNEIALLLKKAHPYLVQYFDDVMIDAIGVYLNDLLILSYENSNQAGLLKKKEYLERFTILTGEYLKYQDKRPEYFYRIYKKETPLFDEMEEWEVMIYPIRRDGFRRILNTQETVRDMLDKILVMQKKSFQERLQEFGESYFHEDINVRTVFTFRNRPKIKPDKNVEWSGVCRLLKYKDDKMDFPDEKLKEYMEPLENTNLFLWYEIEDFHTFAMLEVMEMILAQVPVRRCRYCGAYFFVSNGNMFYCNHIAEGETKPCNEVGPAQVFAQKTKSVEVQKIYMKAYKTRFARRKNKLWTNERFLNWQVEAKKKRDEVQRGELSEEAFLDWIKNN